MVDLIDLCSTYSAPGVSAEDLQRIAGSSGEIEPRVQRRRRTWNRLSEDSRRGIAARYEAGESSTALGENYGVAKSTILNILRANKVVVRRQSLEPAVIAEAAKLYESGLSLSQVASRMKVNQETMRTALIAMGVRPRAPSGG